MCTQYSGNLKDLIIIPFDLFYSNLCNSYDRTSLVLTTFVRLCLYMTTYYYFGTFLQKQLSADVFEYVDIFLIAIVLLNVLSLSVALSRIPAEQSKNN